MSTKPESFFQDVLPPAFFGSIEEYTKSYNVSSYTKKGRGNWEFPDRKEEQK